MRAYVSITIWYVLLRTSSMRTFAKSGMSGQSWEHGAALFDISDFFVSTCRSGITMVASENLQTCPS